MRSLPGFRDFLPNECAARNYLFAKWREVCRRYGFVEWDGPVLEPTELYQKKSGPEIVSQLFNFTDKGEREVAMRPELTPTLARVVAAHEREFRKPLKWFSIPQCFRYEKQQRGRLREHFQLNCDLIGDDSLGADVELIALAIDLLRAFGFTNKDIVVRISDRNAWVKFLGSYGLTDDQIPNFLAVIDKLDRRSVDETRKAVEPFGVDWSSIQAILATSEFPEDFSTSLNGAVLGLSERGFGDYIERDFSLVRGLAYYTGIVFEAFDRQRQFRAIAGGGRYDKLIAQLSGGAVHLPAAGFAMGDVVLSELIASNAAVHERLEAFVRQQNALDFYLVIAKEERREDALRLLQQLRDTGWRVDYASTPAKVGKQFQTAESLGAKYAILFGDEWPAVKLKNLAGRAEELVPNDELVHRVGSPS